METNALTNLFGIQCGVIENPNIAATAIGICFKNENGNWIKFNPETRERVDMGGLNIGNLGPLYLIPSRTVEIGTPIFYEGEYYYVMDTEEWPKLTLLSVKDGVEKAVYPSTNLLGINFFAKVVALINADELLGGDSDDLLTVLAITGGLNGDNKAGSDSSLNNLLILSAISDKGENGSSLLSGITNGGLLGGLGGNDDSSMSKILPLLLLTGGLGGNTNGQTGGIDINTLALLSVLGKKDKPTKKVTKHTEETVSEEKSTEKPLTKEDVAQIVSDAIKSLVVEKTAKENTKAVTKSTRKAVEEKATEKSEN